MLLNIHTLVQGASSCDYPRDHTTTQQQQSTHIHTNTYTHTSYINVNTQGLALMESSLIRFRTFVEEELRLRDREKARTVVVVQRKQNLTNSLITLSLTVRIMLRYYTNRVWCGNTAGWVPNATRAPSRSEPARLVGFVCGSFSVHSAIFVLCRQSSGIGESKV